MTQWRALCGATLDDIFIFWALRAAVNWLPENQRIDYIHFRPIGARHSRKGESSSTGNVSLTNIYPLLICISIGDQRYFELWRENCDYWKVNRPQNRSKREALINPKFRVEINSRKISFSRYSGEWARGDTASPWGIYPEVEVWPKMGMPIIPRMREKRRTLLIGTKHKKVYCAVKGLMWSRIGKLTIKNSRIL